MKIVHHRRRHSPKVVWCEQIQGFEYIEWKCRDICVRGLFFLVRFCFQRIPWDNFNLLSTIFSPITSWLSDQMLFSRRDCMAMASATCTPSASWTKIKKPRAHFRSIPFRRYGGKGISATHTRTHSCTRISDNKNRMSDVRTFSAVNIHNPKGSGEKIHFIRLSFVSVPRIRARMFCSYGTGE